MKTDIEIIRHDGKKQEIDRTHIYFNENHLVVMVNGNERLATDSAALFVGFIENYFREMLNIHLSDTSTLKVAAYPVKVDEE